MSCSMLKPAVVFADEGLTQTELGTTRTHHLALCSLIVWGFGSRDGVGVDWPGWPGWWYSQTLNFVDICGEEYRLHRQRSLISDSLSGFFFWRLCPTTSQLKATQPCGIGS